MMSNRDRWKGEPDPGDMCCFVDLCGTVRCIVCGLNCQDDSCTCEQFEAGAPKGWVPVAVRHWKGNFPLHPMRWTPTTLEARGADGIVRWELAGDPLHPRWRLAEDSAFGPYTPPGPPPWVLKACDHPRARPSNYDRGPSWRARRAHGAKIKNRLDLGDFATADEDSADAIRRADAEGWGLNLYADPEQDGAELVDIDDAIDAARIDSGLVYLTR